MIHSERFFRRCLFYHQLGSFQRILNIQYSSLASCQEESTILYAECGPTEDRGHRQALKGSLELSGQFRKEASKGCSAQVCIRSWRPMAAAPSPDYLSQRFSIHLCDPAKSG